MNAPFLIPVTSDGVDWDNVERVGFEWHGRCVAQFAKVEAIVAKTLLHYQKAATDPLRLDHLAGHRADELDRFLTAKDGGPAQRASAALKNFRRHERLRTFLCHGTCMALIDRGGTWHLTMDLVTFGRNEASHSRLHLRSDEAEATLKALCRDAQRLEALLTNLQEDRPSTAP